MVQPAHFENGMVSTTEWQADASLWKEDTFFDAGTFCLPSVLPEASLEAYKVEYDLETGIHYVFITMKGILGLSISTSGPSSHVAEFSNGVMKAVPRRGKGGVSRHENPNGHTNSYRHTNSNIKPAINLQEVDPAILRVRFSDHMEADGYTESEATPMLIDDSITATGRILGSSKQQPLKTHEHFSVPISSADINTISCSTPKLPTEGFDDGVEGGEPHSSSTREETLLHQQAASFPMRLEAGSPNRIYEEADSSSSSISNTETIEEQIALSDHVGAGCSTKEFPEQANSLHILTDLVVEDGISLLASSASESPADDGGNTPSMPTTNATSPTFSPPLDLPEIDTPQEDAPKLIYALDLEEKLSVLEPWHWVSLQWLDLAISEEQDYINYTCEKPQKKGEPKYAPEDENVDISPRISSPAEVERPLGLGDLDLDAVFGQSATDLGGDDSPQEDQTVDISPHHPSPGEVEEPMRLEDLDMDAMFGQSATDPDAEGLPQEAVVLADEIVAANGTAAVETPNDYNPDVPAYHHLNLLRNPVYQASQTPSALSLWVTMASIKRVQIEDPVSLKAVISSQAARWIDPVLLEEGVSVPEEVRQDGSATAYRNSLIGLTTIQYEPYGTWQSDSYDDEQEKPHIVEADNKEILDEAYEESYEYAGLQRPYPVNDKDVYHHSYSFPYHPMKQQRGWENLERRGNSNLRFVLDEDSITGWQAPAATSPPYEAAETTDLQEEEDYYAEDSLVLPAEDSEREDPFGDSEADEHFQYTSSLRSLLASSSLNRGALSPPKGGRFFTPGIREEYEELDDLSGSLDGDAWETDEHGAFVSPKKSKERLGGEMVDPWPMGLFRNPTPGPGIMMPTEGATEGENALPVPMEEPITQEDVLRAGLSIPYHKYTDSSEIPRSSDFAATVGQARRRAARWLVENLLW